MRRAAIAALLVAACSGDSADDDKKRTEAAERCAVAAVETFAAIAEGRPGAEAEAPIGCAELYRRPRCAAAWRGLTTDAEAESGLRAVHRECAADYCDKEMREAACSVVPGTRNELIDAIVALDTAILKREGLGGEIAVGLGQRARAFQTVDATRLPGGSPDAGAAAIAPDQN
jgi:hypothetical protein